jgi:hypothetical protein
MDNSFKFFSFLSSLETDNKVLIEAVQSGYLAIFESSVNYPPGFSMDELKGIKSFAGRLRYINSHLQKIGAGTSRIAYSIDDNTILKMAKNSKGISQNGVENDVNNLYPDITPEVIDADYENDIWIVAKRAKKLTSPKRFEELTKIPWETYIQALRYELEGRRDGNKHIQRPSGMEELYEHEFFYQVTDMAVNYDMPSGDLLRLSSYAEIDGKPVLMDSGLTKEVYKEHYER